MKTVEPNLYPLACVPDLSCFSPPSMGPTSYLGQFWSSKTSAQDLLGLDLMALLAKISLAPDLPQP